MAEGVTIYPAASIIKIGQETWAKGRDASLFKPRPGHAGGVAAFNSIPFLNSITVTTA